MYLYTISDIHYAIYLEDACEGVYIVEPIILYDYKPNGELVDEDTKEILTGILETTQRLNTYNCTKLTNTSRYIRAKCIRFKVTVVVRNLS